MKAWLEKSVLLTTRIPFLGGVLLSLAALSLCLVTAFTLISFAIYLGQNPTGFVIAGFPIYLLVFPNFIAGFALFLVDYWMLLGIYKVFGWEKHGVIKAILRALE